MRAMLSLSLPDVRRRTLEGYDDLFHKNMRCREFLEEHVQLIERLVGRACRRVGIASSEIGDMASMVKLALVENDYAILRRYEGRSAIATYLTVCIQRLLADHRERTHGRWRPSPEAQRLGEGAVVIEDVVQRQGRSLEEALPFVRAVDATATLEQVSAIAERLPHRPPRPREVPLAPDHVEPIAANDCADARAVDGELRAAGRRAGALLRDAMAAWPPDDRLLVRLRFESSLSIADIARLMNVPQRPLYRRLESLLARLREILLSSGIDPAIADNLITAGQRIDIDFGPMWKNGEAHRTEPDAESASAGERA